MPKDAMGFKPPPVPKMDLTPMLPHLVVKFPRDVEKKKGWSKSKALKDAIGDAFKASWKVAIKSFASTFIKIFKEEIDEYVDWNPDDILLTIRIPLKGLRWIPLKRIKLSDLKKWVED